MMAGQATVPLEELELELLLTAVAYRFGYDFRGYSRSSLHRRIERVLEQEGLATVSALQERVLRNPVALTRLLGAIAVHATSLFREPRQFAVIGQKVMPLLRTWPYVRIWVAGCATGEEAVSIAILLAEAGLLERARIYATDLSPDVLAEARRGAYLPARVAEAERRYRLSGGKGQLSDHFQREGDRMVVRDHIKQQLVIAQHDLVSDGSLNEFHLVLCRNVMIYFDSLLKDRVHRLLYDSLVRFGVLALGPGDRLEHSSRAEAYAPFDEAARLFRKMS
jgi:chemotaxis protein methyltransferase CheR